MHVRKLLKEDLHTRVEWMNNPLIYSSMHYQIPITIENTIRWWEKNQSDNNREDIVVLENDEIVAMSGFTNINHDIMKAETYLFTNPHMQGRGIGSKAKKIICDYGFNILNLNKLYFITNEDNLASIHVNIKCGFILEGRFRQEYLNKEGLLKDRLYFGLLREDWLKNKTR